LTLPGPKRSLGDVGALEIALLAAYALTLVVLAVYGVHRWVLLRRYRSAPARPAPVRRAAALPLVTVQLPVYNERYVAGRLVDAVAALDYPPELLEIQVLDDSDDDTVEIVDRAVARHEVRGLSIVHLRRGTREGYKAGALAYGLARARGELIAVFDADFVPAPGFLREVVPELADPAVGMVQARWGHLNRRYSALTATQALMLDGHFLIEHSARAGAGCFFNFNGTAGVWRRRCIAQAGGWQADTLTEDLDLSYRAQLAGWRFVYLPGVVVAAELPVEMNAFKSQQRRWAKGAFQTARKLLAAVLRSSLPRRVKREAFFHLTASASYPLMALLTLLFPVAMWIRHESGSWPALLAEIPLLLAGTASVCAFYAVAQRAEGRLRAWEILRLMALGVGISISNGLAVLEAVVGRGSPFQRTPKTGVRDPGDDWRSRTYRGPRGSGSALELAFAAYQCFALAYAVHEGIWLAAPFLTLFAGGYLYVGALSALQGRAGATSSS
jgi:cellulose synthase/poly-beta-1,6-N-acetylglucosamine synthase-like glycosyltransferase